MTADAQPRKYLHLVRQDCPLPAGAHVVIYCRDSGGEEQDRSTRQQLEAAREYCNHHNLVIEREYIDEARTGSSSEKRDQLNAMLTDLRERFKRIHDRAKRERFAASAPMALIAWKSNRLGRDSIEATNIKTDLRLRGIAIVDLVTSANTGNAGVDMLIEAFQQWQDEMLLNEISDNAKRGLAQLVATRDTDPDFLRANPGWQPTGAHLGILPGGVPTGFKAERITIGTYARKSGRRSGEARVVQRIVPDPDKWALCRMAWEMRHAGATYGEIHRETRLFGSLNSYATFFSNRIYTGDLDYAGTVFEGFVPALVPREWWEAEGEKRARRGKHWKGASNNPADDPNRLRSRHLLSGLLYCGHTAGESHVMNIQSIPASPGKRREYIYYVCSVAKASRGQRCRMNRISAKRLEEAVISALMRDVLTVDNLRPIAGAVQAQADEVAEQAKARHHALQTQLAEAQTAVQRLLDSIERMGYSDELHKRYNERIAEEQRLKAALAENDPLTRAQPQQLVTAALLGDWVKALRSQLENGDRWQAYQLIRQFVHKITYTKETCTLEYTFPLVEAYRDVSLGKVDLREHLALPNHSLTFPTPQPLPKRPAADLRTQALLLHARGLSYRKIAAQLGVHWTRVHQVLVATPRNAEPA